MLDSLFCVNLRAAAQLEAGAPRPLFPPKMPTLETETIVRKFTSK